MKLSKPRSLAAGGLLLLASVVTAAPPSQGPHGGTLVPVGEDFAFLEVVLSPLTGVLRVYVLDRMAQGSIRLSDRSLHLKVRRSQGPQGQSIQEQAVEMELNPVTNASTGEVVGDTSEFAGQSNALVGASRFQALLHSLRVWGTLVQVVRFDFP